MNQIVGVDGWMCERLAQNWISGRKKLCQFFFSNSENRSTRFRRHGQGPVARFSDRRGGPRASFAAGHERGLLEVPEY